MPEEAAPAETQFEKAQRIALEILGECRVQLMMKFRFLDIALWKMEMRPVANQGRYALGTDGSYVYFEPFTVVGRFTVGFDELVRDYLHLVMHCLFRHPFDTAHGNARAWWLACDVIAENAAMDLCGTRFASPLDGKRREALDELVQLCGGRLTPGNLYGVLVRSLKTPVSSAEELIDGGRMNELHALFERDYHASWPSSSGYAEHVDRGDEDGNDGEEGERRSAGRDTGTGSTPAKADDDRPSIWDPSTHESELQLQNENEHPQEGVGQGSRDPGADDDTPDADDASGSSDTADAGEHEDARGERRDNTGSEVDEKSSRPESGDLEKERDWEDIARQTEMDLKTFSKEWGYEAGGFIKSLAIANRKKYDYSDFLRRFTTLSEEMVINDDEFDYVFYTYGLRLYGNMPLIEPLEYKETQRIRDFAICIDTSESCDGELVRKFVEHTFNIMKEQEDYAHKVNIHVIQCDSKVQSDTKIEDIGDVERFVEDFTIRGLGGTDFRPAFAYIDDLRKQGQLGDMKGMVYFTDGLGEFPEQPPDYDVAFVFVDSGDPLPNVPPWAMRVLVDEEGINRFENNAR